MLFRSPSSKSPSIDPQERRDNIFDLIFSLSPVIINFLLVVFFDLKASVAMALVTFSMIPLLYFSKRPLNVKEVFVGACDWKMLLNVLSILYFIQILTDTNVLNLIVDEFKTSPPDKL